MLVWPRDLLGTAGLRWRIGGAFETGPQVVSGEDQERSIDPGGSWIAELTSIRLVRPEAVSTYEALMLNFSLGATLILVPRTTGPLRPWLPGASAGRVPHSDGTPFSDGTDYVSSVVTASLVDPIVLGDTTTRIQVDGARPFRAGEPFTISTALFGDRLHGVAQILAVAGDVYTVLFAPPARDDYPAGSVVDFDNPRCTMRVKASNPDNWPTFQRPYKATPSLTFRETFKMDAP